MKKLRVVFLFVFLVGCSSNQNDFSIVTQSIVQTSTPIPTQTAAPPTQTLTPTATFTPTVTSTAIGGGGGKIAFTSERNGAPEIYVINPDGSNLIKLTNDITPKYAPSWSPDGKKIVFGTNDNDSASLYIMNGDGSNPMKLIDTNDISTYDQATSDWQFGGSPVWSPDGTKIAFRVSYYIGCCFSNSYIHVVNADGNDLVGSTALPIWERFVWSPDSQKIAFGSGCGGWGICVMNADGTNLINLTRSSTGDGWPSWSPDGKRIAFSSHRNGMNDIYVMNADGTNIVDLTNNNNAADGGPEFGPIWSPVGEKIVFTAVRDDGLAVYVMNADGTNLVNLTSTHPAGGRNMVWSPDSTKIAFFISDMDNTSEIYVVDADGTNLVRLTNNDVNDYSPVWSP
jgi:Tol biopolymer transport system component